MPIQAALLGSGIFAQIAYIPALSRSLDVSLHTIWSRSAASAETLAAVAEGYGLKPRSLHGNDGLDEILADPEVDAVLVVLPLTTQPDLVIQCLQAGKHVLSEKPLHKDVKSAMALIRQYEADFKGKGLIWRVAENFAHEPILRQAAHALRSTELGPVLYWQQKQETVVLDASQWHATSWRTIPDYQGGFILDGGVHQAALLRTVLPNPPAAIISVSALHRTHLPPHDTICALALPPSVSITGPHGPATLLNPTRDTTAIPVELGRSESFGQILLTWATPDTATERSFSCTHIACVNGTVRIEEKASEWILTTEGVAGSGVKSRVVTSEKLGVPIEIDMFGRAVMSAKEGSAEQERNFGEPRGAAWDLALIEACLTSAGSRVSLDDLLEG